MAFAATDFFVLSGDRVARVFVVYEIVGFLPVLFGVTIQALIKVLKLREFRLRRAFAKYVKVFMAA